MEEYVRETKVPPATDEEIAAVVKAYSFAKDVLGEDVEIGATQLRQFVPWRGGQRLHVAISALKASGRFKARRSTVAQSVEVYELREA